MSRAALHVPLQDRVGNSATAAADAVLALINASPRTPTRDELAAVIAARLAEPPPEDQDNDDEALDCILATTFDTHDIACPSNAEWLDDLVSLRFALAFLRLSNAEFEDAARKMNEEQKVALVDGWGALSKRSAGLAGLVDIARARLIVSAAKAEAGE